MTGAYEGKSATPDEIHLIDNFWWMWVKAEWMEAYSSHGRR